MVHADLTYYERQFNLDGTEVDGTAFAASYGAGFPTRGVHGLLVATDGNAWFVREGTEYYPITINPFGGALATVGQTFVYQNGYIYTTGAGTAAAVFGIVRYPAPGGVVTAETGTYDEATVVSTNVFVTGRLLFQLGRRQVE